MNIFERFGTNKVVLMTILGFIVGGIFIVTEFIAISRFNIDMWLFGVWPYVAILLAVGGSVYRYFSDRFSYSSQSSQFLGGTRPLFFGSVSLHYGIILILVVHALAFLFAWTKNPLKQLRWSNFINKYEISGRYVFEVVGWIVTVIILIGLTTLILRRLSSRRLLTVTSIMYWVLIIVIWIQVYTGLWIAYELYPGSQWYSISVMPWLRSLLQFDPQVQLMSVGIATAWQAKLHFVNVFLFVAIIPFTRLVHLFTVPFSYLWRPFQVVIWNRKASRKDELKDS